MRQPDDDLGLVAEPRARARRRRFGSTVLMTHSFSRPRRARHGQVQLRPCRRAPSGCSNTYESNLRGNPAGLPSNLPCFTPSTARRFYEGRVLNAATNCGKVGEHHERDDRQRRSDGGGDAALANRRVVLGVTGGIAAYKAAELVRLYVKAGATVRVVMTEAATRFITPLTLQTLSAQPWRWTCSTRRPRRSIGHIRLADEADIIVVAPATADFIARMAAGMANDLLAAVVLATRAPILLAPAMNVNMWDEPAHAANLARLLAPGRRRARDHGRPRPAAAGVRLDRGGAAHRAHATSSRRRRACWPGARRQGHGRAARRRHGRGRRTRRSTRFASWATVRRGRWGRRWRRRRRRAAPR